MVAVARLFKNSLQDNQVANDGFLILLQLMVVGVCVGGGGG